MKTHPAVLRNVIGIALLGVLVSCSDELSNPTPDTSGSSSAMLTEVELPGYLGVSLSTAGLNGSRGDTSTSPSIGGEFHDGETSESLFSPGVNHHFILLYESGENKLEAQPEAIIPLTIKSSNLNPDDDSGNKDGAGNTIFDNLTLTISKIVMVGGFSTEAILNTKEKVTEFLTGKEAYFLLNFDKGLIYQPETGSADAGMDIPSIDKTKSTLEILGGLKKSDLKKLNINDYKITVSPTTGELSSSGTEYLTMANSVYVSTAGGNSLEYSYGITPDNVFSTEREAGSRPAITGYVERLACKYTAEFTDSFNPDESVFNDEIEVNLYTGWNKGPEGYVIDFTETEAQVVVMGFGVNCLEPSTYALKKVATNKTYFNGWNDFNGNNNNNRCYWSEDPHYILSQNSISTYDNKAHGAQGYPHQFRRAMELDTVSYYHSGNPEDYISDQETGIGLPMTSKFNQGMCLKYRSFDDMYAWYLANPGKKVNENIVYSLENTYSDAGMDNNGQWVWPWNKAPYSAATNFTLLCRLAIRDVPSETTLYRGQNNIFYASLTGDRGLLTSKLDIFNKVMLDAGNAGVNILHAHWSIHQPFDPSTEEDHLLSQFGWQKNSRLWISEDSDPSKARRMQPEDLTLIAAELAGGDGQRLIAPKLSEGDIVYEGGRQIIKPHFFIGPYKTDSNGQTLEALDDTKYPYDEGIEVNPNDPSTYFTIYADISYDHLVALIHKFIGPIDVFTGGKMYYSVPVPHSTTEFKNDDTYNESNQLTSGASWRILGKIGTVRNNWYKFTITGVSGVGTPVDVTSQPIIPVMEVKRSYINGGVDVLDWHKVKQTGVPFL